MDDDFTCIEHKPLIIDAEDIIAATSIQQNGTVFEHDPVPEATSTNESAQPTLSTYIDILDLDDPSYLELEAVRELSEEQQQLDVVHRCFVCPSRFRAIDPLRHHMKLHANTVCAKCGDKFFSLTERNWHMRAVHGEDRDFQQRMGSMCFCRFCAVLGFPTMEEACEHLKACHAESIEVNDPNPVEEDEEIVVSTAKEEQETYLVCYEADSKPDTWKYYCNSCDVYIIGQKYNSLHNKHHKNPQPTRSEQAFACQNCPSKFESRVEYSEHVKEHALKKLDDNSLLCLLCKRIFATETGIKQHIHAQHVRKALGHSCRYCSEQYPDSKKLWKHKWAAHRVMLGYKCESCGQQFSSSRARTKHKLEAHEQDLEYRKRMCRPCYILFDTVELRKQHDASEHQSHK